MFSHRCFSTYRSGDLAAERPVMNILFGLFCEYQGGTPYFYTQNIDRYTFFC